MPSTLAKNRFGHGKFSIFDKEEGRYVTRDDEVHVFGVLYFHSLCGSLTMPRGSETAFDGPPPKIFTMKYGVDSKSERENHIFYLLPKVDGLSSRHGGSAFSALLLVTVGKVLQVAGFVPWESFHVGSKNKIGVSGAGNAVCSRIVHWMPTPTLGLGVKITHPLPTVLLTGKAAEFSLTSLLLTASEAAPQFLSEELTCHVECLPLAGEEASDSPPEGEVVWPSFEWRWRRRAKVGAETQSCYVDIALRSTSTEEFTALSCTSFFVRIILRLGSIALCVCPLQAFSLLPPPSHDSLPPVLSMSAILGTSASQYGSKRPPLSRQPSHSTPPRNGKRKLEMSQESNASAGIKHAAVSSDNASGSKSASESAAAILRENPDFVEVIRAAVVHEVARVSAKVESLEAANQKLASMVGNFVRIMGGSSSETAGNTNGAAAAMEQPHPAALIRKVRRSSTL